ncbi:hypothetical protein LPC08_02340 [Roseomonas sp. OT10]|uniref:hypothetical protein n=1 Tax=Roseomonas cutis TaxID=2897332 RepID=UPI001E34112F|nr:hypothetical protein [Roseomonas sp. OT10]UFN49506.1 hypothetical protein LPC08_02340 [Roseomonas sp. OT10]
MIETMHPDGLAMSLVFLICSCLLMGMMSLPLPACLSSPHRRPARRVLREILLAGVLGLSTSLLLTELALLLDAL